MVPGHFRLQDHEKDYERSQKKLEIARMEASRRTGYDSKLTRTLLSSEFARITGGLSAYTWQIDMAEALLLGLGCSVIAGTGTRLCLYHGVMRYRIIIVTSPDIALEHDPFHSLLSVILDEAHCISQWGDKFCPIYQRLEGASSEDIVAQIIFEDYVQATENCRVTRLSQWLCIEAPPW
ncbi:hypothetical protein F5880DRAFT_1645298 [Lentinula raphanica]|nr:hypothetical protein F5880DRAFT_1645298 [Lentinula raphanica]